MTFPAGFDDDEEPDVVGKAFDREDPYVRRMLL